MIPTKPPPTFKDADRWSKEFLDFVSKCLVKNPEERATATQLLQVSVLMLFVRKQGWHCGEIDFLPPVWPGLNSGAQHRVK